MRSWWLLLNAAEVGGNSPLGYAARGGSDDVVALLLGAGASFEYSTKPVGTPLL
jgi:ankyrin repeat protein